jgi:SAM-dependent methyltransferase
VAKATGIDEGTRVLDVGCGSGEFCRLAAARGAVPSGIDAAEGMIEIARRIVPDGDFRVGAMESLPWDDDSFDVVTGFNSFQFAADLVAALADARRVVHPGGRVAICNWGRPADSGLVAIMGSLRGLQPPPLPGPPPPDVPATGEPGVLEELARRAGLDPVVADEVGVPFEASDRETLERALLAPGGAVPAIEHSGEEAVRKAIVEAAAPFRRPDGSYRIENRFRYLIAEA